MPVKRFLRLLLLSAMCISVPSVSATARAHVEEKTQDQRISESVAREVQVGERVKTEVEKHFSLVENPVLTARVASVFNRLTPYASRPLPYSVAIVKDRYPNAFCIPGGNVYVTTALLDFVKSDDELAFILAHELGHADGNHVIRQLERNQRLSDRKSVV